MQVVSLLRVKEHNMFQHVVFLLERKASEMDSSTAVHTHTHRALESPTELNSTVYCGAVWLDQAHLRHSTSRMHEGVFWCVAAAIRCSYRLTAVFCRLLIQSAQEYKRHVNVKQPTVINIKFLIDNTNSKQSNFSISLPLVHSGDQLAKC